MHWISCSTVTFAAQASHGLSWTPFLLFLSQEPLPILVLLAKQVIIIILKLTMPVITQGLILLDPRSLAGAVTVSGSFRADPRRSDAS